MKLMIAALMVVAAVGQCTPQGPGGSAGPLGETLGGPVAADAMAQQAECEKRGGRWGQGGRGGFNVCYMTPPDAGKSCLKGSDCQSLCLGKSRTCAPVTPLFGCHDMLDNAGRPQEICID